MKKYLLLIFVGFYFIACNQEPQAKYEYYSTGEKKSEKFWNAKLKSYNGTFTKWHKNGKVGMEGMLSYSKKDGLFTYYDPAGWRNCEAHYTMGEKTGNWYYFNENKDTTKVLVYEGGNNDIKGFEPIEQDKQNLPTELQIGNN